ncbi:ABC transporter ATP-binding protein [Staphylococcus sp. SQ8-PEA]|uniref:ABC transporter ATP-binding protein n=1 Tax=Staphylococcus marylandisciuri TaxID=2981529 RepID=A0ABT2QSQ5_9STAP|nr:ABC transporter ATP-binding protein [Staphylococcus marylandisciuri]MCU5747013.1 ABC transporter ATP-binding protein [Staphylococcus marylandisciuri]
MCVIQTKNLTKEFKGFKAVDNLNLTIPNGEISGFLGPNGSGKTTTIRMLLGLAEKTSGDIKLFNKSLKTHKSEILSNVGALVDSPSFYEHLSGFENLKIMQLVHNCDDTKIQEVLSIVELTEAANKKVKDYSLGMKQRLGIAIALMNDPKLLILDEPTNGLDPNGIKKMRELLIMLSQRKRISIVVSSHNLFEIENMCNYVCLINKGTLLYQGELKSLLNKYAQHNVFFNTSDNTTAKNILKDYNTNIRGDKLNVNTQLSEIPKINKILVTNNMDVFEITHEKTSLEDIFLKLTEKKEPKKNV